MHRTRPGSPPIDVTNDASTEFETATSSNIGTGKYYVEAGTPRIFAFRYAILGS